MFASKIRNFMVLGHIWLGLFLLPFLPQKGYSQLLRDGSFELQSSATPNNIRWTTCMGDPDMQVMDGSGPGIFGINTPPAHGQRYLGLLATQQGLTESVGQELKLESGMYYFGSVEVFRSMAHQSWNGTGQIQIWGGTSCNALSEMVWTTGTISHLDTWQTIDIAFTPLHNHTWLSVVVALDAGSGEMTYICIDDLQLTDQYFAVDFLNFEAVPALEDVMLQWETAALENNMRFDVEWSADGEGFQKVGDVQGMAFQSNFEFVHAAPVQGRQFYRIRTVDQGGHETLSEVLQVVWGGTGVQVFPNPGSAGNPITISANGTIQSLRLLDLGGKTLVETSGNESAELGLELPAMAQGCYLLQVQVDGVQSMHRLLIR
jgi:hypothetical protein